MTPASRYIARLCEHAVDRGLDVDAIRKHLASRGVARSPAMVRNDLDNVYSFHGYAASHPPSPARTVKEWDRAIDQGRG
jgi:hypothetical protein